MIRHVVVIPECDSVGLILLGHSLNDAVKKGFAYKAPAFPTSMQCYISYTPNALSGTVGIRHIYDYMMQESSELRLGIAP